MWSGRRNIEKFYANLVDGFLGDAVEKNPARLKDIETYVRKFGALARSDRIDQRTSAMSRRRTSPEV